MTPDEETIQSLRHELERVRRESDAVEAHVAAEIRAAVEEEREAWMRTFWPPHGRECACEKCWPLRVRIEAMYDTRPEVRAQFRRRK